MKIVSSVLGVAALLVVAGCLEQVGGPRTYKGPLLRYHFAGHAHFPASASATRLKEISALPQSAALRAEIAKKLAAAALPFWSKELPAGATDQTMLLQPLVNDFLTAESFVEVRGAAGSTDTALAVELSDERALAWSTNLKQLMTAWKLGATADVTTEGFKGWEVKRVQAPDTFQFFRAGKWVVIGLAQGKSAQVPALLAEAKKSGRPVAGPGENIYSISADLPALRAWVPVLAQFPLPPVVATVSGKGDSIRTEVKFQYSGKIPWAYEPWKIPTNIVTEPLTSFTVGQGIAPLLGQMPGMAGIGLNPLPNQFCAWGLNHDQCRMYFAVPVTGATNAMSKVSVGVPKFLLPMFTNGPGNFLYQASRAEVIWGGVPFIMPFVHPEKDGKDEYLFGGNFPPPLTHTPVPDELFAQVRGRTNLVYYDWEITEQRLNHGRQFYQLMSIVDSRRLPGTNSVSKRWLSTIGAKLGNTATEIVRNGPQELALVRKSHVGFTGFELATLSAWIDSPGFPLTFDRPGIIPRSGGVAAARAALHTNGPAGAKPVSSPPGAKR